MKAPLSSAARAAARRVILWRIRRKGIDLSNFQFRFIPQPTRAALQRNGTDPVPRIAELRATDPVHRLDLPFDFPVHLVTDFALGRAVLTEPHAYSNDIRHLFGASDAVSSEVVGGLGFTDAPQHTRLRHIVTPEFTRRRLLRLQPAIDEVVERQLDALESAGPGADLARLVSFPVPFTTICELLGLPDDDRESFARLGVQRFDATVGSAAFGAVSAQRQVLLEAVERERKDPGTGLIGQIIRDEGDTISDVDLAGLADGIFTGGYETTAGMISLSVVVLLRDPAHAELMRSGSPQQIDRAVEELLRYLSVVQVAFPRFAKRDIDLGGHHIGAGDAVIVSLSGANRDPAFTGSGPDSFDPARIPPSGHLAFGHGAHRCIGAELARMELRTVLPALLRRFPDLALAVPQESLSFRQLSFVYGIEKVPVVW